MTQSGVVEGSRLEVREEIDFRKLFGASALRKRLDDDSLAAIMIFVVMMMGGIYFGATSGKGSAHLVATIVLLLMAVLILRVLLLGDAFNQYLREETTIRIFNYRRNDQAGGISVFRVMDRENGLVEIPEDWIEWRGFSEDGENWLKFSGQVDRPAIKLYLREPFWNKELLFEG